ncbi:MAG: hypothetical protein N3F66_02955 [Spirochaetes bacterium]|nr:hypothetical protein [Spirochaetota bacterium]
MIHVALKNPSEKLVHIDVIFDKNKIAYVHISGDFFIYPEEAITTIEKSLIGLAVNKEQIQHELNTLVQIGNIQLVGISPATIVQGILEAFAQQ